MMKNMMDYTAAFNNGFMLGMLNDLYKPEYITTVKDSLSENNPDNELVQGLTDGYDEGIKRRRVFEAAKRQGELKELSEKQKDGDKNLGR